MGRPLVFEILDKPATSCFIGICSAIWFYIQKKNIGEAGQKRFLSASRYVDVSPHQRPVRHSFVCEVATKKPDSAMKRDRLAKKTRIYNKSQKSEIKTWMKLLLFSASSFDFS